MTPAQCKQISDKVTADMLMHTQPFVTPLGTEPRQPSGWSVPGSYIQRNERRILLTCEHVARVQPMHHRFYGSDDVFEHPGPWTMDRHPTDAAFAPIQRRRGGVRPHIGERQYLLLALPRRTR